MLSNGDFVQLFYGILLGFACGTVVATTERGLLLSSCTVRSSHSDHTHFSYNRFGLDQWATV